jgi:hypothetical protein
MPVIFLDPSPSTNDGFDVEAQYQMVPAGGVRRMGFWVQDDEPEDVIIYCTDPNKAYLYGLYIIQGHAAIQGSGYFVKRGSAIRFFIGGRDPGATVLTVETVSGRPRGFLLVSVKPQLRRTYQLAIISDPIHVPTKDLVGNNLAANMLAAAKLWLEQANISLERVGPINDVIVPMNLEDPLVIDDLDKVNAIARASHTPQLQSAHIYVYGTWNLVYRTNPNVGGSTSYNMCFVENQWTGRSGALICAHELGHALGLQHSTGLRIDLLMQASAITNDFLDMLDIEWTNRLPWPPGVAPGLYGAAASSVGENHKGASGPLRSNLFAGDVRLEACALSNPSHVTPGATGPHVRKIQAAVMVLDGAVIVKAELDAARYGPSTARAVLAYKTKRRIINRAYESQADDIVGIMTIKALDSELVARQIEEKPILTNRCPRICGFRPPGSKDILAKRLAGAAGETRRAANNNLGQSC